MLLPAINNEFRDAIENLASSRNPDIDMSEMMQKVLSNVLDNVGFLEWFLCSFW